MKLGLSFYIPDQPRGFKRKPNWQACPQLMLDTKNTFRFNAPALAALGIRLGQHVQLGNDPQKPSDWYVTKQPGLGFELLALAPGRQGLRFTSKIMRDTVLATLPYAPPDGLLTFKLDAMPVELDGGGEAWPLLTAPYLQPQAPPVEKVLSTVLKGPPGLLTIRQQAELYGYGR